MSFEASRLSLKDTFRQIYRFTIVGIVSNCIGYCVYIVITYSGGTPKLTMTALYFTGAVIGFFANRKFTFQHAGRIGAAGLRYFITQLLGYLLNFLLLLFFVDWLGFAHQIVQAAAIVVVAVLLFVLSRFFVFAPR